MEFAYDLPAELGFEVVDAQKVGIGVPVIPAAEVVQTHSKALVVEDVLPLEVSARPSHHGARGRLIRASVQRRFVECAGASGGAYVATPHERCSFAQCRGDIEHTRVVKPA
jgi:hypothetical protein